MKKLFHLILIFSVLIPHFRSGYSQSSRIFEIIDSIVVKDLNYNFDSSLTNILKPYPLIILDGNVVDKEKLSYFSMMDIKSIKAIPKSDSLAFQIFDKNAWGGIITIETNLSRRKLKRKL